jgi:hypothetical protein
MIGNIFVVLLGIAALMVGVVVVWYAVGLVVLRGVSLLFPLVGGKKRKKGS